jgi:hypothetical protein
MDNGQVTGGDRTKMSAVERTGTSSGTQEQSGNMKKFVGHFFFFFPKRKHVLEEKWK